MISIIGPLFPGYTGATAPGRQRGRNATDSRHSQFAAGAPGCVATIGNFDGVHLGHQRILDKVIAEARARDKLATVMLFEPQPQEFFAGRAPRRA